MQRSAKDHNTDLFRELRIPGQAMEAWGAIYTLYWDTLVRYISTKFNTIDPHAAEDIAEGVLLKLWEKRQRVAAMDIPKYWLFKAAKNDALDFLKTRKRKKLQPMEDHYLEIPDESYADADMDPEERWERIRQAMARLPPETRKVLAMRYGAGIGNGKIATELGKSPQTVGNQLLRGIRKLQKWLNVKKSTSKTNGESKKSER
ncbi:RNA polymerase sigma factor [Parapedobacter koreensis]|uniref:RNA polymerase sigma-70 factor, ECF subfamily n=1 Tax=Parapedobacter koreensis TaxID=332977 RepID=A0A1H7GX65_9SPHI|nr:sigma-70 family RNA polymerase sigma factor [Parapedobacter koreensis]SEK41230.1 RNA polymerase sigma-70 factor, ECF subfamily [Parapedobacter koreensis]